MGPAIARRLAVLGIETIGDLAYHFPRRYDDFSQVKRIRDLELGELVTVVGVVRSISSRRSGGRTISSVTLADDSGAIECTWFNQPYLDRSLRKGQEIAISGEVGEFRGRLVFSAPEWEPLRSDSLNTGRVVPVYPLTEGLYARALRRLIHDALQIVVRQLADPLPPETRASHNLLDLAAALEQITFRRVLRKPRRHVSASALRSYCSCSWAYCASAASGARNPAWLSRRIRMSSKRSRLVSPLRLPEPSAGPLMRYCMTWPSRCPCLVSCREMSVRARPSWLSRRCWPP